MVKSEKRKSLIELVEQDAKYRVLVVCFAISATASLIQTIVGFLSLENAYVTSIIPVFILPLLICGLFFYLLKSKNYSRSMVILVLSAIPIITYRSLDVGGIYSNIIYWYYVIPIISLFFVSKRFMYIAMTLSFVSVLFIAYQSNLHFEEHIVKAIAFKVWPRLFFFLGPLSVLVFFISIIDKEKNRVSSNFKRHQDESLSHLKLASISEISGGLAHEINNPLNNIKGLVFKLKRLKEKRSLSDEKIDNLIEELSLNSDRIANIVTALGHIAKDRTQVEKEIIHISDLFIEIEGILNTKKETELIDIQFTNLSSLKSFNGQILLIEQVLINLIFNAIDAVLKNDNPQIRINCKYEKKSILFEVIDNGIGISSEIQSQIFLPFFTTKKLGEGTGLGLSLSKGIIDAQNGDIYFSSSDIGTTFTISLPLV